MKEIVIKADRVIEGDFRPFAIELKDKKHYVKEASIRDYIKIEKILAEIKDAGSVVREVELLMDLLVISFPTVDRDDFGDLTPGQLVNLANEARIQSGQAAPEEASGALELDKNTGK